jgi:hypothetical protein
VRAPPSRMTRVPLLRRGAVAGSFCTVLGVDAEDSEPDLVADPEDAIPDEPDAIRRGIQELPRRRRRHLEDGVVPVLDVLEDELQRPPRRAPPSAAPGGVVARRRRGRPVVGRQLPLVPPAEEGRPRLPVVRVEARIGAARRSSPRSPRRWRRRAPLPSAAAGWGCRRRSGANLRAPGSPAAPCSRRREGAGPPIGGGIGGRTRCSLRRRRRKGRPLVKLEDAWARCAGRMGKMAGECGRTDAVGRVI